MNDDHLPNWEYHKTLDTPSCLEALCLLKRYKDKHGKDEYYLKQQPIVWELSFAALEAL